MSNAGSSSSRKRQIYEKPLRKPGENVQESGAENEEKPAVQPAVGANGNQQEDKIEQDVSGFQLNNEENQINKRDDVVLKAVSNQENQVNKKDDVLLRAVGNPEFVPRSFQKPGAYSSLSSSSFLQSAINAPEFIPGQPFHKYESETPAERQNSIAEFVSDKIKQVRDDPGLLDEVSIHMAKYLSGFIKNKDDLKVVSDLLFENCVSEQNFQYTGSRLANHLDKSLNPTGLPEKDFRKVFLKRCQVENKQVGDMIQNDSDRVSKFALFLGELLMNYKTVDGSPIKIFCIVVLDIIQKFLGSKDRKLLICAGKLLKLTGSVLDENQEELFQTVKQMASSLNVDRTARDLFTRVGQLRSTNWGRDEKSSQSTQPPTPEASVQASSLYIQDLGTSLEEQYDVLPVVAQEQWNEFAVDSEEDNNEELYKLMSLEQYGFYYTPYATTDNSGSSYHNASEDNYDADYEEFLQTTHGNS